MYSTFRREGGLASNIYGSGNCHRCATLAFGTVPILLQPCWLGCLSADFRGDGLASQPCRLLPVGIKLEIKRLSSNYLPRLFRCTNSFHTLLKLRDTFGSLLRKIDSGQRRREFPVDRVVHDTTPSSAPTCDMHTPVQINSSVTKDAYGHIKPI